MRRATRRQPSILDDAEKLINLTVSLPLRASKNIHRHDAKIHRVRKRG